MINNILNIYDENGNIIHYDNIEIKSEKSPRSSVISKILYIDGKSIIGNNRNTYKIQFKCNCGNISTVALKYYLSKVNIHCNKCSNRNHVHHYDNPIKQTNYVFDEYNDDFKSKYWNRHLHYDEFINYLSNFISINGKKFNINDIVYYEHLPINNQSKFTSFVSFNNGLTKESLKSVELKCALCNKVFSIHPFNIRKYNINNIKCKYCGFNTISFKLKQYKNTNITYQSNLEKTFLDYCFNYGIKVMNGFEIPYWFNNKLHTYVTDFYLPEHKIILELKGCNPFFINDLKSGKIEAKNSYANQFAKEHGLKFKFIRDYDLEKFINYLSNQLKKYIIKYYI